MTDPLVYEGVMKNRVHAKPQTARAFALIEQDPKHVCRLHPRQSTNASAPRRTRIRCPLDPRKQQMRQNLGTISVDRSPMFH